MRKKVRGAPWSLNVSIYRIHLYETLVNEIALEYIEFESRTPNDFN